MLQCHRQSHQKSHEVLIRDGAVEVLHGTSGELPSRPKLEPGYRSINANHMHIPRQKDRHGGLFISSVTRCVRKG